MKKFHLNDDGDFLECRAKVRDCHFQHFRSVEEFENHVKEEERGGMVESRFRGVYVPTLIAKNTHYVSLGVPKVSMSEVVQQWSYVCPQFEQFAHNRHKRDKTEDFHITIVSPQEFRKVFKKQVPQTYRNFSVSAVGIGKAEETIVKEGAEIPNETWFAVVESPEIDQWRADYGLPPHDLHITLGFKEKDIHGVDKGAGSVVEWL